MPAESRLFRNDVDAFVFAECFGDRFFVFALFLNNFLVLNVFDAFPFGLDLVSLVGLIHNDGNADVNDFNMVGGLLRLPYLR